MALKIGEMLLDAQLITPQQLEEALEYQKEHGGKLGYNIVQLGFVEDEDITQLLSEQYGVPAINLAHFEIEENVIKLIPAETAQKYHVIPVSRQGATLTIAMTDPTNVFAVDDIKFMTGYNVEPVIASELAIKEAIDKYYGTSASVELKEIMAQIDAGDEDSEVEIVEEDEDLDLAMLEREGEAAPVVKMVNHIIRSALEKGASDIHIEPYEKDFRIRFRIDGVLYEEMRPPMKIKDGITSRFKILANLDIAEKRLPQDGRIKLKMTIKGKKKEIDFRTSVCPLLHGEKIVLRVLDKEGLMLDMTKLGFEESSLNVFKNAITKPFGMILVTGPTGSGKTNTLYSAMEAVNTPETNIMTAEDPVEFNIKGINQVQMRDRIGLNFAAALRSFLRQDPNIVLVGEIRDFETAEISIKAALTGHLVFSTLHTNDAPSTINRLMNMGVEPFLVATSVICIQAQRLIRRVCKECKEPVDIPKDALLRMGFREDELDEVVIYKGSGCPVCHDRGYKGRVALIEVFGMTPDLQDLVLMGASTNEVRKQAMKDGMITMRRSGLEKIKAGITTPEEVIRETVLYS